jgi:hypothetical protein
MGKDKDSDEGLGNGKNRPLAVTCTHCRSRKISMYPYCRFACENLYRNMCYFAECGPNVWTISLPVTELEQLYFSLDTIVTTGLSIVTFCKITHVSVSLGLEQNAFT